MNRVFGSVAAVLGWFGWVRMTPADRAGAATGMLELRQWAGTAGREDREGREVAKRDANRRRREGGRGKRAGVAPVGCGLGQR